MVKKDVPRQGDEVMDDPSVPMIPNTTPSGLVIPTEAPVAPDPNVVVENDPDQAAAAAAILEDLPTGPTILLESGGRRPIAAPNAREFRVTALDGLSYEHCGETPSGEWTYRKT